MCVLALYYRPWYHFSDTLWNRLETNEIETTIAMDAGPSFYAYWNVSQACWKISFTFSTSTRISTQEYTAYRKCFVKDQSFLIDIKIHLNLFRLLNFLDSYLDSGRKVMDLFRARGWTTIISNNLVGYVLSYTAFSVGILSGFIALLVERIASQQLQGSDVEGDDRTYDSLLFGPIPGWKFWTFG